MGVGLFKVTADVSLNMYLGFQLTHIKSLCLLLNSYFNEGIPKSHNFSLKFCGYGLPNDLLVFYRKVKLYTEFSMWRLRQSLLKRSTARHCYITNP